MPQVLIHQNRAEQIVAPELIARVTCTVVLPANLQGFTVDPRSGEQPEFKGEEYIVSLRGHEQRFAGLPSQEDLACWIDRHASGLDHHGRFIGGWVSDADSKFHLDVSFIVRGERRALKAARQNGQQSIYHPATGKMIWLHRSDPNCHHNLYDDARSDVALNANSMIAHKRGGRCAM